MVIFKPENKDVKGCTVTFSNLPAGRMLRVVTWAGEKQKLTVSLNGQPAREVALPETLKPGSGQLVRFHVTEVPMDIPKGSSLVIRPDKSSHDWGLDAIAVTNETHPAQAD